MWEYLKTVRKPILLYGMGDGAEKILAVLREKGIPVAGIFASDGFVRGHCFAGFPVMGYTEAKEKWGSFCVLVCFGTHRPEVVQLIRSVGEEQELYAPDVPVIGDGLFTREYAEKHRAELEKVYAALADEQSRLVFCNVIEYKLTGKIEPLFLCETPPGEAWQSIIRPTREEIYMDLGAYTGDTIREFIGAAGEYRAIYAVEPDPKTFARLQKNTADLHDCVLFRLGIHSTYAQMPFAARGGRNSALAGEGRLTEMDSVDHLLCGRPVTYIKMDVEGQERAAIAGVAETIRRHRPRMMISAYHRTEDLFALPLQVLAMQPDYKLYLRHYPCLPAWDTAYYFV